MTRDYKYMGYTFRQTDITHGNTGRFLYEIDDLKPAGTRPFLTSISQVKQYIRDYKNYGLHGENQSISGNV